MYYGRRPKGCKKIQVSRVIFDHFKYRHQVDDQNNLRRSLITLETPLINTKDWKICVLTFILALVEVNAPFEYPYFSGSEAMHQIQFRRILAKELLLDYAHQV